MFEDFHILQIYIIWFMNIEKEIVFTVILGKELMKHFIWQLSAKIYGKFIDRKIL